MNSIPKYVNIRLKSIIVTPMETKNILLVGVGFHARRIYIPSLIKLSKDTSTKLVVCIDILSQKSTIDDFLKRNNYNFKMEYVEPLNSNFELTSKSLDQLNSIVTKFNIQGVIISTEPLTHKSYAKWALSKQLNILMDKPITTRNFLSTELGQANGLIDDYNELLDIYNELQESKSTIFSINTQRRYDTGFKKVLEIIKEARDIFNVPITSIQAMYADGTWVHPSEILNQLSHPYLHGYGICSHSGYHILDMVWQLYKTGTPKGKGSDEMQVYSSFLTPHGYNKQITEDDYARIFKEVYSKTGIPTKDFQEKVDGFGEIDSFSIMRLLKNGVNICNISINLMHNSFSRRSWTIPNKDLYKGNGRVKHQQFIIQQGPFQSIHIQNFQSSDKHDKDNSDEFEIGGNNHFDIHVFRNKQLFGSKKSYYKISNKELLKNITNKLTIEETKDLVILEFLEFLSGHVDKKDIISNIDSHEIPVKMMSGIYQSNILFTKNLNSTISFKLVNNLNEDTEAY